MTKMLTLEDLVVTLPELLETLLPGEEIILTRNHLPVARLVSQPAPAESVRTRKPRQPGNCQGMMTILAEDGHHLKGFEEYMFCVRVKS